MESIQRARKGDVNYLENVELDVLKDSRDEDGSTVLAAAARAGNLRCCQVIYKRCPELLYYSNINRTNVLHIAAYHGRDEVLSFLLYAKGGEGVVDNKLLMMVANNNYTPLHDAGGKGHLQAAKLLIEADPDHKLLKMKTSREETPMHIAVRNHRLEIVKLLLETDPDFQYSPNYLGNTPLFMAMQQAFSGDPEMVEIRKLLMDKQSSQCKVPTGDNKWTLLHHATYKGDLGAIEEIIRYCPECIETVDSEGQNYLHLAAKYEHENVVKHILGFTNASDVILNGQDSSGNTPLHIAASRGNVGMGLSLLYDPRVKKLILNKQGKSALDMVNFDYDKRRAGVYGVVQRVNEKELKDRSDFDLLVGALISTVSFTAGITLPGGFQSDGNAVLYKKTSFEAFVLSNTIALSLSLYAVFIHFCTKHLANEEKIVNQLKVATFCTLGAIFAMMVAFITGSYAVLSISKELSIAVSIVCCFFFIFAFYAILEMIKQELQQRGTV